MQGDPVAGDLGAAGDPDIVVLSDQIEKTGDRLEAGWLTGDALCRLTVIMRGRRALSA
jgi:hypothetical protein